MRTIYLLICFLVVFGLTSRAQDTVRVKVLGKNVVTVVEDGSKTDVRIGDNTIKVTENDKDTVENTGWPKNDGGYRWASWFLRQYR